MIWIVNANSIEFARFCTTVLQSAVELSIVVLWGISFSKRSVYEFLICNYEYV